MRFDAEILSAYTDDLEALVRLATTLAPDIAARLESLAQQLPAHVFEALAPKTPETRIVALAKRPVIGPAALLDAEREAPAVWLENPAHLGNIGAVVRVAAAAGASAVFSSGRHDPWDPAALRGSAGLHFALPVIGMKALPESCGPRPTLGTLIAIDPEGDPFRQEAVPAHTLLAFGSERHGLSSDVLAAADQRLALPMRPNVSSLNLATAVSAVLYAWRLGNR